MVESASKWISEFEFPHPLQEHSIGDGRGIYLNSFVWQSYFRNAKYLYPELVNEAGVFCLYMRTECPIDFEGKVYRLYSHRRNKRVVHFLPLPKFVRAVMCKGRRRLMYSMKILLDEKSNIVIRIEPYGGK